MPPIKRKVSGRADPVPKKLKDGRPTVPSSAKEQVLTSKDLLPLIFQHLDSNLDRFKVGNVCTTWRELSAFFWKSLDFDRSVDDLFDHGERARNLVGAICRRYGNTIERLSRRFGDAKTCIACKNLKAVEFPEIETEELVKILASCPLLDEIQFFGCDQTESFLPVMLRSYLKVLVFTGDEYDIDYELSDEEFKQFVEVTDGSLETLVLVNCSKVELKSIVELVKKSPNLKELDVHFNMYYMEGNTDKYPKEFAKVLCGLKNLKILKVNGKLFSKENQQKLKQAKNFKVEFYNDGETSEEE